MSNQYTNSQEVIKLGSQVFDDEIAGLNLVRDKLGDDFVVACNMLLNCKGKIVVTGIGKSGHIANKIAATLASTGSPAFFVHPAEALHGDLGMIDANDVVIGISYSGESDELGMILPIVRRRHIPIIAITGGSNSTLAKCANVTLDIKISKEACPLNLAPTTSTTATLAMGDALAVTLLSLKKFKPEDFALSHPGGSLGRRLLTKVTDIMHSSKELPIVYADSSFEQVIFEISDKRLGMVAVLDNMSKVIGLITDGDIRRAFGSKDLLTLCAKDIMKSNPKMINIDAMAVDAVALIEEYKISGLLVVDNENKLVGAFNVHDLFKAKLL